MSGADTGIFWPCVADGGPLRDLSVRGRGRADAARRRFSTERADGVLDFFDRANEQVKIGAFRI